MLVMPGLTDPEDFGDTVHSCNMVVSNKVSYAKEIVAVKDQ